MSQQVKIFTGMYKIKAIFTTDLNLTKDMIFQPCSLID